MPKDDGSGPKDERSVARLLGDLASDVTALFRTEMELAKTEVGEKANQAVVAIGMIAGGAALGLAALLVLLQALVIALTNAGIPAGWSSLIVGVVVAVIGYVLVHKGTKDLKASHLAPERTIRSVGDDVRATKQHV